MKPCVRELYRMVFNESGSVKPCGRDLCKQLMQNLSEIFPDVCFGNMNTGQMDIDVIYVCMERICRLENPDACKLEEVLFQRYGFYLVDKSCDEHGRATYVKYVQVRTSESDGPMPLYLDVADDVVTTLPGVELYICDRNISLQGTFNIGMFCLLSQLMDYYRGID